MTTRARVGLLGGTFDPIHNGHLAAVRAAQQAVPLSQVRFVPSARPPHRPDTPRASEYHRVEMIRRAIGGVAGWEVSDLELRRDGPSYSFDTLTALHREGLTPLQICFIIGADAFAEITTWHRYPDVLSASHFVVVTRPGCPLDTLHQHVPSLADRLIAPEDLPSAPTARVVLVESSTPDVSSTEVRRRAARGEPVADLVPASVAAYIAEHRLYRPTIPSGS
jgi:nicotinate-nucleotide adenylyltransferase